MNVRWVTLGLALAGLALGQEAAPPGPHGGLVSAAGSSQVETIIDRDGVEVLLLDAAARPIDPGRVTGQVEVRFVDASVAPQSGALAPRTVEGARGLGVTLRLGRVVEGQATVTVRLQGVPGAAGEVALETPFRLARAIEFVCPMACVPPQPDPGACRLCKMDLVPEPFIFVCPAHPQVTSRQELECWVCEAPLRRDPPVTRPGGGAGHGH